MGLKWVALIVVIFFEHIIDHTIDHIIEPLFLWREQRMLKVRWMSGGYHS